MGTRRKNHSSDAHAIDMRNGGRCGVEQGALFVAGAGPSMLPALPETLLYSPDRAVLPLANASPAAKLVGAFLFAVGVTTVQTPLIAAASLFFPLVLLLLGGVALSSLLKRLAPINLFFLFLWCTLPLSWHPYADTLAQFGPLYVRKAGLVAALAITLKGNAVAATLLLLAGTSPVTENARALRDLRVPEKLVTLLLLTHGHIRLMQREAKGLFNAARLRGFSPTGGKRGTYRGYAWLLGLLFTRAFDRAERVDVAMRLRGFQGHFPLVGAVQVRSGYGVTIAIAGALCGLLALVAEVFFKWSFGLCTF